MAGHRSWLGRWGGTARGSVGAGGAVILLCLLPACSIWELGPEPDYSVTSGREPRRLTDANLEAVTPVTPGDKGAGVELPGATLPTTAPATQSQAVPPEQLSVQDAILVALQNNTNLRVQKLNVPLRRLSEEQARAAFDPDVSFSLQGGRNGSSFGSTDSISGSASITEFLPTGTTIQGSLTTSNSFYSEASSSLGSSLSVTQSILRGAGLAVNLVSLRQAELSTRISQYELRAFAESMVADIETAYWDLAYGERQVAIVQSSLDVALRQLEETNTRINVGDIAASERAAAEAEVASRRESLIAAQSNLDLTRMRLMRLLTPAGKEFWNRKVNLTTLPFIPPGTREPVEAHVDVAQRFRPEVNQSKLQLKRGDLEIVRTKNGLLPRLDLFLNLGKTGLSSSFGESITELNGPDYSAILGVRGDWDPVNRAARASYRSAELSLQQQQESLDNLAQTIQLDVRTQYIQVETTRRQIDASRATRLAQEQKLVVEQGKLRAGNGRSLDVAIAQRDLLSSQLSEVQSVTNHLKALVSLYRLEGSLLFRRGLDAPGAVPVDDAPVQSATPR